MKSAVIPAGIRSRRIVFAAILALTAVSLVSVRVAWSAPPAGTPIDNQASATYLDASNTARTATSASG